MYSSDADLSLRFSDPDMMMRYHWGLGVGHYHVHQPTSTSRLFTNEPGDAQDDRSPNIEPEGTSDRNIHPGDGDDDFEYANDDPELGLEDRHLAEEGWESAGTDSSPDGGHSGSDFEDIEDEDYTGL
jgi:hypothetical protein